MTNAIETETTEATMTNAIETETTEADDVTHTVRWSDGRVTEHASYGEAVQAVEAEYPDAAIGHSGDLAGGGDRTLCWADEESAADDDGQSAVAAIRAA